MKQIVDKLNKIAKKIDESVEIPQTDLIIDSLDAITKAYGGTPNDSNLIVDKLEDIYNNIGSGGGGGTEAHTVSVTLENSELSESSTNMTLSCLVNGFLAYNSPTAEPGESVTFDALLFRQGDEAYFDVSVNATETPTGTNCTIQYTDGYLYVTVDPDVTNATVLVKVKVPAD